MMFMFVYLSVFRRVAPGLFYLFADFGFCSFSFIFLAMTWNCAVMFQPLPV